jgi:flagellar basal body-associated protein FliL
VIADKYINIRTGAGKEFETIGKAYAGDTLLVYGFENEWAVVKFNGRTGYVNRDYVKVIETDKSDAKTDKEKPKQERGLLSKIMGICFFVILAALVFLFFWLAEKSRSGEIIIYKSWADAWLSLFLCVVSVYISIEGNTVIGCVLLGLSFVFSCWISVRRNRDKKIVLGIIIGIARMLIIYLIIAMAIIAWTTLLFKKEKMEQASHMRRRSERTTKAKNDKIREAELLGIIAAIGFALLSWLTVSFIHSKNDKNQQ